MRESARHSVHAVIRVLCLVIRVGPRPRPNLIGVDARNRIQKPRDGSRTGRTESTVKNCFPIPFRFRFPSVTATSRARGDDDEQGTHPLWGFRHAQSTGRLASWHGATLEKPKAYRSTAGKTTILPNPINHASNPRRRDAALVVVHGLDGPAREQRDLPHSARRWHGRISGVSEE